MAVPEQDQVYASAQRVEQLHTADNAWRANHAEDHREVDKVLGAHEHRLKTTEERLANGATTFEELRKAVAPKPVTIWQVVLFVLGPLAGIAVLIGGFIWQAARYPDRTEFRNLQQQVNGVVLDQVKMQGDVAAIRTGVERAERQQDEIAKKLDAVLLDSLKKAAAP